MIPPPLARQLTRHLARRRVALPADFPPTVTFTFDDVPASAVEHALPQLAAAGHAATWYVAADLLGRDGDAGPILSRDDVLALQAGGQEIGSHGFAHVRADRLTRDGFAHDLAANAAALQAITGTRACSFSFPFGAASPAAKRIAMAQATSARGIAPGIARGAVDLALLPANAVYGHVAATQGAAALLRDVAAGGGWAILYTHDIAAAPSRWGCTPDAFARLLALSATLGLRVATVGAVVRRLSAAQR